MLTVHHVSKSYRLEIILNDITFSLNAGERLGLVGPNGCSKITLIRILAGLEVPDSGAVQFNTPGLRIVMLSQGFYPETQETMSGFLSEQLVDASAAAADVERLAGELAQGSSNPGALAAYNQALVRLEAVYEQEKQSRKCWGLWAWLTLLQRRR
jgi:ATPase subunit of ABC transporter with duplicated ATPase domains